MKKLGLFFVVLLFLGLFLVPKNVHAIIGADEKNKIVTEAIQAISAIPGYNTLSTRTQDSQKREIQRMANEYFDGVIPTTTFESAASNILLNFATYLNISATSNSDQKEANIVRAQWATVSTLYNKYENARLVANNTITQKEADIKNAEVSVRNASVSALSEKTQANELKNPCSDKEWGIPKDITGCSVFIISNIIKTLLLSIVGFFLWAAANFLNFGIQIGILNFSTWAPNELYPIWQIVRQIVSLCVIFAGLYMGFMYIINSDTGSRFIERYIPWLIIFALFVNFSYPITRSLIDISNVISINIYAAAVGSNVLDSSVFSIDGKNTAGGIIMDRLGLQGIVFAATGASNGGVNQISGVAGTLLAIIFILYAAYIFAFAALLIMIRNITLVLGIIGSPLLLIDMVVPKFGEKAAEFRTFFFNQLALSVVFMIMFYFTIKVMGVFNNISYGSMNAGGEMVTLAKVMVSLVLLHIMLKVTREFSGAIGKGVEGLYKTAALGAVTGGGAALGRATLGRFAAAAADSNWVQNNRGGFLGGKLHDSLKYMSDNATFDVRNVGAAQKLAGMGGVELGQGTKKNYTSNLEMKQKAFATKYNGMNEKARKEFQERTLTGIGNWDGQGERIAGETLYKAKNEDGSDVLSGEEKQRMYDSQDRSMRKNLLDHDMGEAEKMNKTINLYEKKTGENKQDYFNNQSDDVKKILIGQDLQKSLMDKRETYSKTSNQARQSYFESEKRTAEEKQNIINMDRAEAENIQKEIMAADKEKIKAYQESEISELGNKQKIYNEAPKALQSKLKSDDKKRAEEINDYKKDIEEKEIKNNKREEEIEKLRKEKEAA